MNLLNKHRLKNLCKNRIHVNQTQLNMSPKEEDKWMSPWLKINNLLYAKSAQEIGTESGKYIFLNKHMNIVINDTGRNDLNRPK